MRLCNFMNETVQVVRNSGSDYDSENIEFSVKAHARIKRDIQAMSDKKQAQHELRLYIEKDELQEYDVVHYRNREYEVRMIQPEYKYFEIVCYAN